MQPSNFHNVMLNLLILLALVKQREKSQKYFSLLPVNWNLYLNHSILFSTLGVTNFSKWELFCGSPPVYFGFMFAFSYHVCQKVVVS